GRLPRLDRGGGVAAGPAGDLLAVGGRGRRRPLRLPGRRAPRRHRAGARRGLVLRGAVRTFRPLREPGHVGRPRPAARGARLTASRDRPRWGPAVRGATLRGGTERSAIVPGSAARRERL